MGADFVTNGCRSLHTRTRGPRAAPAAATCGAVVLLAVVATAATGCGGADADPATIARAKQAFAAAKADGVDMSRGPCLGVIEPGWVADVAHDPREDVDDEPANQCAAYRSGEAEHFVELDPAGNVIRSG